MVIEAVGQTQSASRAPVLPDAICPHYALPHRSAAAPRSLSHAHVRSVGSGGPLLLLFSTRAFTWLLSGFLSRHSCPEPWSFWWPIFIPNPLIIGCDQG